MSNESLVRAFSGPVGSMRPNRRRVKRYHRITGPVTRERIRFFERNSEEQIAAAVAKRQRRLELKLRQEFLLKIIAMNGMTPSEWYRAQREFGVQKRRCISSRPGCAPSFLEAHKRDLDAYRKSVEPTLDEFWNEFVAKARLSAKSPDGANFSGANWTWPDINIAMLDGLTESAS